MTLRAGDLPPDLIVLREVPRQAVLLDTFITGFVKRVASLAAQAVVRVSAEAGHTVLYACITVPTDNAADHAFPCLEQWVEPVRALLYAVVG